MPITDDKLRATLDTALRGADEVHLPFPPCSDVLLSRPSDGSGDKDEEVWKAFDQYFGYGDVKKWTFKGVDEHLSSCLQKQRETFPPSWCFAPSCVQLNGYRPSPPPSTIETAREGVKRLFLADLVWLFFMERMGIFQMQGALLDDYARKGKYPLANGDLGALMLEAMVRQTKAGLSSTLRDRESTYRRSLGWTTEAGRKLDSEATVNSAFNEGFHRFLQLALHLYRDKRLAALITPTQPTQMSSATLAGIQETLQTMKVAMKAFDYGRNYSHTLSGIVWAIASLILIRDLRDPIGVSSTYKTAAEYFPAAHQVLVAGSQSKSEMNRYILHRDCAVTGRNILLDLEFLEFEDTDMLVAWLRVIEGTVERYATAYRALTGIDLGGERVDADKIHVEQQV